MARLAMGAAALTALSAVLVSDVRRQARARARLQEHRTRLSDGLVVSSLVGGSDRAPAIVLVPGFGVSSAYMVPLAAALSKHWRVHALDLPGHGATPLPNDWEETGVLELHIGTVAEYMRTHRLRDVCLLGHSFGAQIAARTAVRSSLVGSLVLVGPTSDHCAPSAVRQVGRLALSALGERPLLFLLVLRDYVGVSPRQLLAELHAMMDDDLRRTLRRLRRSRAALPVVLLRGPRDAVAPARWLRNLLRTYQGARGGAIAATLSSGAHGVHFTAPGAVARRIRADVQRL